MNSVLLQGFGSAHAAWTARPGKAAIVASGIYFFIVSFAIALGIHWEVRDVSGQIYSGFLKSHWGPLFFLAMPITTYLMGLLFQELDRALLSLDKIVIPTSAQSPPFSDWLAQRFRNAWNLWIFPVCFSLPIALSLAADGSDILAPLESATFPASVDKDWSTLGYKTSGFPLLSLLFNFLAFGMQAFLGYCGFLLIFVVSFLLWVFAHYGLTNREWNPSYTLQQDPTLTVSYTIQWDFSDGTGRCGIFFLDKVFAFYVAIVFVSFGLGIWSVLANAESKSGIDIGSAILTFCNLLLLPAVFIWIIIPYWTHFPRQLPPTLKNRGYTEPRPWPFGAEKLTLGIIAATWAAWIYLLKQAWDVVRDILGIG